MFTRHFVSKYTTTCRCNGYAIVNKPLLSDCQFTTKHWYSYDDHIVISNIVQNVMYADVSSNEWPEDVRKMFKQNLNKLDTVNRECMKVS